MSQTDRTHPARRANHGATTPFRFLLLGAMACLLAGGCSSQIRFNPNASPETPALSIDTSDGVIDVRMEAPHPGWTIASEGSKRSGDGPRVLVTITRPDPGLLYPQVIATKSVRTNQAPVPGSRVWVRLLDHDQRPPAHHVAYAPTDLVIPDEPNENP